MTPTGERPTSGNLNIIFDSVAPVSPPSPSWWVASRMAGGDIVHQKAKGEAGWVCVRIPQSRGSWSDSPTRRRGSRFSNFPLPLRILPSIRQPTNLDWTTKHRDPWSGSSWSAPTASRLHWRLLVHTRTSLSRATSDVAPPSPELLLQTAKRAWMRPDDAGLAEPWIQIVLRPGCRVLSDLVEGNRPSAS
ncbi:hypothetical protein CMUS01_05428 [Colletotrichum musicola]|uniref:Uncharacterized protein n=1 Tax=Colletotrichum musicola TaxID=2175873 RepID=A0A8H6KSX9_9PEZI|nr:hypothetical protein CMUS01_05428 [Colletotrichum musicola]